MIKLPKSLKEAEYSPSPVRYPFAESDTLRLLRLIGNCYELDESEREIGITWIIEGIKASSIKPSEYMLGIELLQMQSCAGIAWDPMPSISIADVSMEDAAVTFFSSFSLFIILNKFPVGNPSKDHFYIDSSVGSVLGLLRSSIRQGDDSVRDCLPLLLSFLSNREAVLSSSPYIALVTLLLGMRVGRIPLPGTNGDEEIDWLGDLIKRAQVASEMESTGIGLLGISAYNWSSRCWRSSCDEICRDAIELCPGLKTFTTRLIDML